MKENISIPHICFALRMLGPTNKLPEWRGMSRDAGAGWSRTKGVEKEQRLREGTSWNDSKH